MAAAGGSHIGLRKQNEDSYYINASCQLFVIADGMGGHEHGQLASQIAVKQFMQLAETQDAGGITLETMQKIFQEANEAIYTQQEALQSGIMGTTLTAVAVDGNQAHIGHVGDSRLYVIREGRMTQITLDHSYYAELMRRGKEELRINDRQKNVLLKALGPEATVEGQFLQMDLQPGDFLLLCTDGFYNAVSEDHVLLVLQQDSLNLQEKVDQLLSLALQCGASDNLTVLLYQHSPEQVQEGRR